MGEHENARTRQNPGGRNPDSQRRTIRRDGQTRATKQLKLVSERFAVSTDVGEYRSKIKSRESGFAENVGSHPRKRIV